MWKVSPRDDIKITRPQSKPRVSCSPQLPLRPLVALPFSLEVSSFSFSTFKVLELLLGFVVLFTVALLSTTCNGKNIFEPKLTSGEMTANAQNAEHDISLEVSFLTCFQFFELPGGSFFHLFTRSTQALQISPCLFSFNWKQPLNSDSYLDEDVNRELEDFAPQIQQPRRERKTRGLCDANMTRESAVEWMKSFLTAVQCAKQVPALCNSWVERGYRRIGFCAADDRQSMLRRLFLSARCRLLEHMV